MESDTSRHSRRPQRWALQTGRASGQLDPVLKVGGLADKPRAQCLGLMGCQLGPSARVYPNEQHTVLAG